MGPFWSARRRAIWLALRVGLGLAVAGSTLLAPAAAASGRVEFRNLYRVPFVETEETCVGDSVTISGELLHSVVIVVDASGALHVTAITRFSATGTSTSGTNYVANGLDVTAEYFAPGDVPANGTFPWSFQLISQDGSANLLARGNWHITVNAGGEVTSFFSTVDVVCL